MIPTPSPERLSLVKSVWFDHVDPSVLSDWEMAWLENHIMTTYVANLAKTNPMVFSEQEVIVLH